MTRGIRGAALALLLGTSVFLLARPLHLSASDLGRHLKNGEIILGTLSIPPTNLYAYTYPDFPFVNHHWGSGVVFYLIEKLVGFAGLHLTYLVLNQAVFLIFFRLAWKQSSFEIAALVALPIVPILLTRPEIRPEGFSYLLAGIFLWILRRYSDGELPVRVLVWLPLLELVWVNLHIYFFFGLVLIGAFLADQLLAAMRGGTSSVRRAKGLAIALAAAAGATILNPSGLAGAVYPFRIFGNYGHAVFENQPLLWLEANYSFPAGFYFKVAFGLLIASWLYSMLIRRRFAPALLLLSVTISVLGWQAVRNFGIFGLVALPITAANVAGLGERLTRLRASSHKPTAADGRRGAIGRAEAASAPHGERSPAPVRSAPLLFGAAFLAIAGALVALQPSFWGGRGPLGVGLAPGTPRAARFFEERGLAGPIFNNYDIGSYLIYYLYPRQRVFVDNRPEAYPSSFFTDTYVPLQENAEAWEKGARRYGFNTIIITRGSFATRALGFLEGRAQDRLWAAVYADRQVVIFLRRDGPNQDVIRDYEICLAGFPPPRSTR